MRVRGLFTILVLISIVSVGCSRKKKSMPFWLLLGTGGAVADNGGQTELPPDSNGVPLPPSGGSIIVTDPDEVPSNGSEQEVPNHGPARVIGSIVPVVAGVPANVICGNPGAPALPNCVDLTLISVRIEVANGEVSTLVASKFAEANGSFQFDLADLPNNNYRVLINTGYGLNYAYQDFSYVYNPTQTPFTLVNVGNLFAERMYYAQGPAQFTGVVTSPGFSGGGVTVPSGPVAGIVVNILDSNGNTVGTGVTNANGQYVISINPLPNGNYTVVYVGDSVVVSGQPYATTQESVHFTFPGTNPNTVAVIDLGVTNLPWMAATESDLLLSGVIRNGALSNDQTSVFTIKLKNEQGAILQTVQITGNGNFSIEGFELTNGVYYLEVSNPSFYTVTQSFLFTAAPNGGSKSVTLNDPILIVAKPSLVVGYVRDANNDHVAGAVINVRPSSNQAPSNIVYLKDDPILGNAIKLWILESLSAVAGTNCALNPTGSVCSCAINPTASCLANVQGNGPWAYQTYANKVYEVNPTSKEVSFLGASGLWAYYISAPGFENYCGNHPTPCSANPLQVSLNGATYNAGTISMTSIATRSQITGSISVRDAAPNTNSIHTTQSGLYVVMLGNTNDAGASLVHITTTNSGQFSFGGSSYVVTLPQVLPSPFTNDDAGKVTYALYQLGTGSATTLSNTPSVARANDNTASVDIIGGTEYNFRQSSYQIIVVDRVAPSYQSSYLSSNSLRVDTSSVATNLYASNPAIYQLNGVVLHSPRATVTGVVTDAVSTSVVSGATITLGRLVGGNFTPDVKRDCSGGFDAPNCSVSSTRSSGNDQTVGSVSSQANGIYSFPFLSPGSYHLRVEKNGITTYFPVEVGTGGGTVVVNTPVITNDGRGNLSGSVRTPGGFAFLGTYSLEIVDPNGGTLRPSAGVQPASIATGSTIFSNSSQYTIFNINAGRWKVRFVSAGYQTVEGIVDIQADVTTNFDIITFVPGSQTSGTVSGRALSALYNTGVCNLTARIRPGVNVKSGPYAIDANGVTIPAVKTSTDGSYAIPSVPPGNYTLEVSGSGKRGDCTSVQENYSTTYRTVVSAGSETPANQNILVTPILGENEMRVVLSWGAKPRDLDSHMQYGNQANDRIVWNNKTPLGAGNGSLDFDITTGYGPETITVQGSIWNQPNRYYSVYNWSGEASMGISGATVRIFKGSVGEVRNYSIAPNYSNRWWKLFCIAQDKSVTDVGVGSCKATNFIERSMYQ
ncbi:Cna protein B-type domain protein [Leptospira levettii]|uniref:Cna protein B-type domain protein n=1 Tax=Leptospira levettii TaxID=2023178 RepID=UPI0010824AC5|nr:Cna protein B-type domain protein [Leptospira levettii]